MTNVLVAEDNPANRELLREFLETRGYSVIEARDGQEALKMVEESDQTSCFWTSACRCSMALPSSRRIRQDPTLATLPVLAEYCLCHARGTGKTLLKCWIRRLSLEADQCARPHE